MNINELTIDFSLPLDADISAGPIVDDEGNIIGHEKNTIIDAVLDRAARLVADHVVGRIASYGDSYSGGVSKLFHQLVEPRINQVFDEEVKKALNNLVTPKTGWGQPEPTPVPLAEWIASKVDSWLKSAENGSYRDSTSRLEKAVATVTDRQMQKALDEAMSTAKEQALAAFSSVAETKLTEALRESIANIAK